MAYSFLSKPGTTYGPCEQACDHTDCAANRVMAETLCTHCGEAIGYDTNFTQDEGRLVHLSCLYEKVQS